MDRTLYYIVVEVEKQKFFVGKDAALTATFEDALEFKQREFAEDFIERENLWNKSPKILSA